jgi:hypothetical protein
MGWPLAVLLVTWCLGLIVIGLSNLVFLSIVREVNASVLKFDESVFG